MFLDKYFTTEELDSGNQEDGKMDEQSLLKQLTTIAQNLISSNVSCLSAVVQLVDVLLTKHEN